MSRPTRILERDGRFYPQWKFPLLPLWFCFECLWGTPISHQTLKEAKAFLLPPKPDKVHQP